jgi:hypothetical protein
MYPVIPKPKFRDFHPAKTASNRAATVMEHQRNQSDLFARHVVVKEPGPFA